MDRSLETLAELFQALGDSTRLRILGLLLNGEVCVCHLHESLRVSQPKASRHLAYLRRTGLVETRRDGLWVYYRLAEHVNPLILTIRNVVAHTLGHVPAISQDVERLRRKTGCCAAATDEPPALACCGASEPRPSRPTAQSRRSTR